MALLIKNHFISRLSIILAVAYLYLVGFGLVYSDDLIFLSQGTQV